MKNNLFKMNLSDNERKTMSAFIDIENGIPIIRNKKTLKQICEKTQIVGKKRKDKSDKTDKSYQFNILKKLIENDIIDKEGNYYFLKSKYHDIAQSMMIQDKIKYLEGSGLFNFLQTYTFGIKNVWSKYPEFNYLHNVFVDCIDNQFKIKIIKYIFLLRDFIENWDSFLKSDVSDEVKYWLYQFINKKLSPFLYSSSEVSKNIEINNKIFLLKIFGIDDKKINEYKKDMIKKKQNNRYISQKEIRFKKKYNSPKYKKLFKEIISLISEYLSIYNQLIIEQIRDNLDKKSKEKIKSIYYNMVNIHSELTNIGFYIDTGIIDGPMIIKFPDLFDGEYNKNIENRFNYEHNEYFESLKESLTDLNNKNINNALKDMVYLNNQWDLDRLNAIIEDLIIFQVKKPKSCVLMNDKLEKLKKKIFNIAEIESDGYSLLTNFYESDWVKYNWIVDSIIENI